MSADVVPPAEGTGEPMGEPLTETREPVQGAEEPTELPSAMGPDLEPAEPDSDPPRTERRRGFRFNIVTGTLVLAAVALLGGFLIVNLVLMPSFTGQGAEVHVPEVIGLSEREAERLLAAEDLKLSKISEQWSPDVPRGFITEQDPPAGGLVKRGRRISVIVSLGAQGTSVPVLEGVTARQATMLLENAGLKVGKTARAYADDVGKDLVIASDPPGETVVEQDAAVDLLVSLGPVPRSFVLPDLSGHDGNAAARGLRDQGIAVSVREGRGSQKSGDVNAQEPPAGRRVAPRDSVILYVQP
jgi:eukaryotic-like serine/threonine-protein kinase